MIDIQIGVKIKLPLDDNGNQNTHYLRVMADNRCMETDANALSIIRLGVATLDVSSVLVVWDGAAKHDPPTVYPFNTTSLVFN